MLVDEHIYKKFEIWTNLENLKLKLILQGSKDGFKY